LELFTCSILNYETLTNEDLMKEVWRLLKFLTWDFWGYRKFLIGKGF
jgi:hypothetical protein